MTQHIDDFIEDKARTDATYAVAYAVLQLARTQSITATAIKNLDIAHIAERIDEGSGLIAGSIRDSTMPDTMIERMARALSQVQTGSEENWPTCVKEVRAVLTAMREPTEAMLPAGARAASRNDVEFRVDDALEYDQADNLYRQEMRGDVQRAFTAMIDAALAEGV